MSIIRLELDVPAGKAPELTSALQRMLAVTDARWMTVRVTVMTDHDIERERTLLAAARYFCPPSGGGS